MTLLAQLVSTSRRVGATSGRLAKIRELAGFLRGLEPDEIETGAHYLSGEIQQGRIGIGYATLRDATGRGAAEVGQLSLAEVDAALTELAGIRGAGSTAKRAAALGSLFSRAARDEQAFLLRLLTGEVRQGALAGVMVDAIAAAAAIEVAPVRRAAMYSKSLGAVARVAMLEHLEGLAAFHLELFSPVAPMLAQTVADVDEALHALEGEAAFEWKMDGARIQVHKVDAEVRIYTRNLNEVTDAIPEIVEKVRALPVRTVVLDGEAIAFDAAERPHPFQVTMRRFGRKLNVEESRGKLPIRAFYFDCLHYEGLSIEDRPTAVRVEALMRAVHPLELVPRLITRSASEAREFYEAALAAGHEGLMAKSLNSPYEAGNRGAGWLKIKRAHTLDLVVLAAELGARPAHGEIVQPASGRVGSNYGRVRHAGKDLQRADGRHARLADTGVAGP